MALTVSSNKVGDAILDHVDGSSARPNIKTEYFSDTQSTWKEFDPGDVEARSIQQSAVNDRYQVHSFLSPVKTMSLVLNNFNQQYSTGSESEKSDILKKNLRIRCWSGYDLTFGTQMSIVDDFTSNTKYVHTKLDSGTLFSDITSYVGTVATAAELGITYSSGSYAGTMYAYPGYYQKRFDLPKTETLTPTKINVAASSNKFSFKYRVSQFNNFFGDSWSTYSSISTGANVKSLPNASENDRFVQCMLRWESSVWDTADNISEISLNYDSNGALFQRGVFLIDEPKVSDKVTISGRDLLKKALETEINPPSWSSPTNISTAITDVLTRCNIPFDTASWDQTSTTISVDATLAEEFSNQSGYKILDKLMDALNAGNDDWQFQFNLMDGGALLKNIPTAEEADFLASYIFNIEDPPVKDFDSDKQLQVVTAMNARLEVFPEELLKSYSGTASSFTITYATAVHVRYEDNNSTVNEETDRTNTSVTLGLSGASSSIDVYGTRPKSITNQVYAERGNAKNIINKEGDTFTNVNEFFTQTSAKDYCDYTISKFGEPSFRFQYKQSTNPLQEINDNFLVFDRDTVTNTIFGLTKASETWNNPELKTAMTLTDKGIVFLNFVWDRNGGKHVPLDFYSGVNDLKYDTSLLWGYDLGPNVTTDTFSDFVVKKHAARI